MSRYIDADKVTEAFVKAAKQVGNIGDQIAFRMMINEIPAADVRENVRGEWVIVVDKTEMCDKEGVKTWGSLFQCNQCGFVLNAIEGHTGQYNYCPNCGAKMGGDKS